MIQCQCGTTGTTWLCQRCQRDIRAALADIATAINYAYELLDPLASRPSHGHKPTKLDPPAPTRIDVLAMLDPRSRSTDTFPAVANTLTTWAKVIADETKRTIPTTPRLALALIYDEIGWVACQTWAADLVDDILALANPLRRALDLDPPRWSAPCTDPDCRGLLRAREHGGVECGACKASWTPAQLQRLGLVLTS